MDTEQMICAPGAIRCHLWPSAPSRQARSGGRTGAMKSRDRWSQRLYGNAKPSMIIRHSNTLLSVCAREYAARAVQLRWASFARVARNDHPACGAV